MSVTFYTTNHFWHHYLKKYKPLAESQIAKAGYRLAAVLNDVFGK